MNLPKNGGVVIIDDKISEAMPLMNALSKQGIAYSYYDGKPQNYPKAPLDSVRLVFLDMHLDEAAGAANGNKNVVSSLMGGLDALVGETNGPYVIMVWSKHDSQHMETFRQAVMSDDGLDCRPIAILNMEKSKCFETIVSETQGATEETEWKLKDGGMEIIEHTLGEQIKEVDAFVLLYAWENGIRNSTKETIRMIGDLFNRDSLKWNANLKSCLARLAKAYAGKIMDLSNSNVIKNSYYAMNEIVNDFNCLEAEHSASIIGDENKIVWSEEGILGYIVISDMIEGKEYIVSCDDKRYYLYEDKKMISRAKEFAKIFNGEADKKRNEIKDKLCDMYWSSISSINTGLNIRKYVLDQARPGNVYMASEEIRNELCTLYQLEGEKEGIEGIEVEMSPMCDYAQGKRTRLRILPGLMIPNAMNFHIDKGSKYMFLTSPLLIQEKCVKLFFDFRFYSSENLEYFRGRTSLYAIGDGLLQVIKEGVSEHGVRSGIISLE